MCLMCTFPFCVIMQLMIICDKKNQIPKFIKKKIHRIDVQEILISNKNKIVCLKSS